MSAGSEGEGDEGEKRGGRDSERNVANQERNGRGTSQEITRRITVKNYSLFDA